MAIGDLRPYERNPRNNDAAVDAVAESVEAFSAVFGKDLD